nr:CPPV222 N1R/p28-like protein [Cooks petrelpox virus]
MKEEDSSSINNVHGKYSVTDLLQDDCVIENIEGTFYSIKYRGITIIIMKNNGYINCSKICKIKNKYFSRWLRLSTSKALIDINNNKSLDTVIIKVYGKGKKLIITGFYLKQNMTHYVMEWIGDDDFTNDIYKMINFYNTLYGNNELRIVSYKNTLCPFIELGRCYYGKKCKYIHGDQCDICGLYILHPTDINQRISHKKTCLVDRDCLIVFKRSNSKKCGICIEEISEKHISEQYFGILPSCKHVFCLSCIRRWADTTRNTDTENTCPECRIVFPFIIPNRYWVDDKYEKKILSNRYKKMILTKNNYNNHKNIITFMANSWFYLTNLE